MIDFCESRDPNGVPKTLFLKTLQLIVQVSVERPSLLDKAAVETTHCSAADLRIDLSLKLFSFKLFPARSAAGKRNQSDL